jgi:hypothetical protein
MHRGFVFQFITYLIYSANSDPLGPPTVGGNGFPSVEARFLHNKGEEVSNMSKGVTICFRTSEWLRSGLETIAREEKRSLSQVIELILEEYLKVHADLLAQEERRRFTRKSATIPAFVKGADSPTTTLYGAVILDISLGGLRISLPKDCISEINDSSRGSQFETSFVLPEGDKPIRMVCKSQRVVPVNGNVYVGATFVDSELVTYRQLQKYFE